MDAPFKGEFEPFGCLSARHAVGARGGIGIPASGAAAPEELLRGKTGEKGGVLGVGVDILYFIVLLHDDRIDIEEDRSFFRFRHPGVSVHGGSPSRLSIDQEYAFATETLRHRG
jgi:hypothetical protein